MAGTKKKKEKKRKDQTNTAIVAFVTILASVPLCKGIVVHALKGGRFQLPDKRSAWPRAAS